MRHDRFEGDEALDGLRGPHRMTILLAVMVAGSIGVGLRYALDAAITARAGDGFPWSTLIINVAGAFILGVVIALLAGQPTGTVMRPAIGIGLIGGFTTFSAFALEAIALAEDGFPMRAAVYIAATNTVGVAAAVVGLAMGRLANPA